MSFLAPAQPMPMAVNASFVPTIVSGTPDPSAYPTSQLPAPRHALLLRGFSLPPRPRRRHL